MRKLLIVCLVMIIYCSCFVFANNNNLVDYHNNITINGIHPSYMHENDIININGTTYLYCPKISYLDTYLLGVSINFNNDYNKINFKRIDKDINMYVNSNKLEINDYSLTMDCSVINIDGKIYVPLKHLSESLGYKVVWNNDTKTIDIDTNGIITGGEFVIIPISLINNSNIECDKVYDEDYTTKYEYVLDKMFSKGWFIEKNESYLVERFDINGKYGNYRYTYNKTYIKYKDFENKDRVFILSNNHSIEKDIESCILSTFENYYNDKYFNNNLRYEINFYFVGYIVGLGTPKAELVYENYISNLTKESDIIDISKTDIKDIFKLYPVCCYVDFNGSESDSYQLNKDTVENIIDKILYDTGNSANICVRFYFDGKSNFDDRLCYINGKTYKENEEVLSFDDSLYNLYKSSIYKDLVD